MSVASSSFRIERTDFSRSSITLQVRGNFVESRSTAVRDTDGSLSSAREAVGPGLREIDAQRTACRA